MNFLINSPLVGIYLLYNRGMPLDPSSKVGFSSMYDTEIRDSVELGEHYLSAKCGELKTGNDDGEDRLLAI